MEELKAKVGQNSSNSSRPPSSDAPADRDARRGEQPTGRPRGGQPGHKGWKRTQLPPEKVTRTQDCYPERCRRRGCGKLLPRRSNGEPLHIRSLRCRPSSPTSPTTFCAPWPATAGRSHAQCTGRRAARDVRATTDGADWNADRRLQAQPTRGRPAPRRCARSRHLARDFERSRRRRERIRRGASGRGARLRERAIEQECRCHRMATGRRGSHALDDCDAARDSLWHRGRRQPRGTPRLVCQRSRHPHHRPRLAIRLLGNGQAPDLLGASDPEVCEFRGAQPPRRPTGRATPLLVAGYDALLEI